MLAVSHDPKTYLFNFEYILVGRVGLGVVGQRVNGIVDLPLSNSSILLACLKS